MWAGLSAKRETPLAKVSLDFVFGHVLVGRELLPGFYVEGGARRLALDINATVETESASRSPGFWDPLIGVTYRRQLGRKWRILLHGDGGGFGAGSDVESLRRDAQSGSLPVISGLRWDTAAYT